MMRTNRDPYASFAEWKANPRNIRKPAASGDLNGLDSERLHNTDELKKRQTEKSKQNSFAIQLKALETKKG